MTTMARFILALLCSMSVLQPEVPRQEPDNARPLVAFWYHAGLGDRTGGLQMAVWNDGQMLIRANEMKRDSPVLLCTISADDIQLLKRAIATADVPALKNFNHQGGRDVGYETLSVWLEEKHSALRWHQVLAPLNADDLNKDVDYRQFVAVWRKVKGAASSVAPVSVRALGPSEKFRGYSSGAPLSTPWFE
jgi:hypothetical protein